VVSLFAVTHQGPAQGGKAGGSKLPDKEFNKELNQMQEFQPDCCKKVQKY
jgi:3-deoxy-D-manno-octulosonic acid (KDO) 8-phosphate synthase